MNGMTRMGSPLAFLTRSVEWRETREYEIGNLGCLQRNKKKFCYGLTLTGMA